MKNYTVAPNKDATVWFIKMEDVAPLEEYDEYDKSIEAGFRIAEENKPSTLTILDEHHDIRDKHTFK